MRRLATLSGVRRVAIVAVAVTGLGLFGTGVRGLTQIDGQLATATKPPATREVKQLQVRDDCPWHDRRDLRRL
ncbi:MAG: hypothetical protein QOK00_1389 [Thermoleophilaceae bacterium]|nr:hypothetical protein [Thermoleophilaceae bacterium]